MFSVVQMRRAQVKEAVEVAVFRLLAAVLFVRRLPGRMDCRRLPARFAMELILAYQQDCLAPIGQKKG